MAASKVSATTTAMIPAVRLRRWGVNGASPIEIASSVCFGRGGGGAEARSALPVCASPASSSGARLARGRPVTIGAAGAIEAAVCCLTIQNGVIPPTINYREQDPACDLDYVPNQARAARVENVLSNSFGFGSCNACLALERYG